VATGRGRSAAAAVGDELTRGAVLASRLTTVSEVKGIEMGMDYIETQLECEPV
jgi:hypothetical protein